MKVLSIYRNNRNIYGPILLTELDKDIGDYLSPTIKEGDFTLSISKPEGDEPERIRLDKGSLIRSMESLRDRLIEEGKLDDAELLDPAIAAIKRKRWSLGTMMIAVFVSFSIIRVLLRVVAGLFFPGRYKLEAIPLVLVINFLLLVFMVWGSRFLYQRVLKARK